ncbi:STAS domain-containing protein [Modestobacter sp. NPDC049651]|uniref:STAS domain-containing protein n=1 Tax=unclassified Modestobacter TaxID=2643866 RepID=UPI0034042CA7
MDAGARAAHPEQHGTSRPAGAPAPGRTEVVTSRSGRVAVHGDLTRQGADLLRGTVETLQRRGHDPVVVDLRAVASVDAGGRAVLESLRTHVAAAGGRLMLRNEPPALV